MLLLTGCVSLTPSTEAPTEVSVQGWISQSPLAAEDEVMATGEVTYFDLNLIELTAAEQPFQNYPGYWRATLPADEEYNLVVDGGDGYYPALYRGRAPTGDALSFPIFGFNAAQIDPFFESLEEVIGVDIHIGTEDLVHVWGTVDPDYAVAGSEIAVYSNDAAVGVFPFFINDDGVLEQSVDDDADYFFAFNLAPGRVTVAFEEDGVVTEERYDCLGGEIVSAAYFRGSR